MLWRFPTRYDRMAKAHARSLSKTMSARAGKRLVFRGWAAGANIFLAAADAATARWCCQTMEICRLPPQGQGRWITVVRKRWEDGRASYQIDNVVITPSVASPDTPPCVTPYDTFLEIDAKVAERLIADGELVEETVEYERPARWSTTCFQWIHDPWFRENHPHLCRAAS